MWWSRLAPLRPLSICKIGTRCSLGRPLVISALDERFVHKSALRAGDAVVAIHQHLPGLIDNILRVLPDTQTIDVVLGDSPLERFWLGEARREFAQFANRVSFEWLNNLSLEQMRQRVAALPPHSAVLYTLMVTDAAGVPQERGAAFASLFEVSAAPIFSLYESELGHGVVGGPIPFATTRGCTDGGCSVARIEWPNHRRPRDPAR